MVCNRGRHSGILGTHGQDKEITNRPLGDYVGLVSRNFQKPCCSNFAATIPLTAYHCAGEMKLSLREQYSRTVKGLWLWFSPL